MRTACADEVLRFLETPDSQRRKPLRIFLKEAPEDEDGGGVIIPELREHLLKGTGTPFNRTGAEQRIKNLYRDLIADLI